MKVKEILESLTPKNIHTLADAKGVKWDDEPSFLALTKRLTGKEHLDDLNQAQLLKVKQYLEKQDVHEGLMSFLSKPVVKPATKPTSSLSTMRAAMAADKATLDAVPPPHIRMYLQRIKDANAKGQQPQFSASEYAALEQWIKQQQAYGSLPENFADGRNPQDKGDSKRYGINTKASVSSLRKTAKQGGRKGQLAHWLANMKAGKKKHAGK